MDDIARILMAGKSKHAGRRPLYRSKKPPIWQCDRNDPANNVTLALISMCIKEDMEQSIENLAIRGAANKERPVEECLAVLRELRDKGDLGYYDRMTKEWTEWMPGEQNNEVR